MRAEFGALDAEEGLDVAHVGVDREQALGDGVVVGHVQRVNHEYEIRPRRHPVTLLHVVVGLHQLERIE